MCAKFPMIIKRHLFSDTIEEKEVLLMEKKKRVRQFSVRIDDTFYEYLQQRAINKEKFMPIREFYELAKKGMEVEMGLHQNIIEEMSEKLDDKIKKALELFNKAEELIKEEGV